jgi:hypothetical protein
MAKDGPDSAMWLRILGVRAVVVSGKDGRDVYKENWRDPDKYRGVLPELWRNGGDVIYDVPSRSDSLVHVVPASAVMWRAPVNMVDLLDARKLDAALADPALPAIPVQPVNDSAFRVSGTLRPEQDFMMQMSYHPGWHATVNSAPAAIRADGVGFMIVEPRCDGPCSVEMSYDGGLEMHIANYVRLAALILMLAAIIRDKIVSI